MKISQLIFTLLLIASFSNAQNKDLRKDALQPNPIELSDESSSMDQTHDSHQVYNHVQEIKSDFSTQSKTLFSENRNLPAPSYEKEYVQKAHYLELEESYVREIKKLRPKTLVLDIPLDGQNYQVQLYRKEITTGSYQVKAASGAATQKTSSVFYRGIIKDLKKSFVSLAVLKNSIHMTISNNSDHYEINKIENNLYAAYNVSDSKRTQDTGCGSGTLFQNENVKVTGESIERSIGDCIEIYIECDFDSFQKNGSSIQNTEDWALAIMNEVAILYENEGVPLVVSDILVYDFADPYLGGSDSGDMLDIMPSAIGDYDGRLAHVFSTRSVGGGIAWVDVLCSQNNGSSGPFAVSGSMNSSVTPFPIYSWNVMVVAHELGHNIGSLHTHDCVWNGNGTQIDDCGSIADDVQPCFDSSNPIVPSNGGTIMSYCHLNSVGINFNNGFGSQPGNLLLDKYLGAGCVTGEECDGPGGGGVPPVADFTFTQFNPCAPSEVQFTDLSSGDPTQFEWVMLGATPNFSTSQNPFVTYNEPGFYDVTLTVTNSDGSDALTLTQVIEVAETPMADFDFEFNGTEVSFSNQTSAPVDSYFWGFGDGNTSNFENPTHTYEEEGTYIVELTVGNACGAFTVEKSIDIFLPPTADFAVDTTFGCAPLILNFSNNSSSNADEFLWTFEGGTPESSTEENPTVEYNDAGTYEVMLKVTNEVGEDSITKIDFITVEEAPTADFDIMVNGLEVEFENLSTGYDALLWEFGDGNTSTLDEPTHTYETEDIFLVILSVINSCDTVTMEQAINLNTTPIAGFSINQIEGCLPLTIEFSNNSSSNTETWEWSFPGGTPSMSTDPNPTIVYETVGAFDVSLKVTNEAGKDSVMAVDLISVSDVPTTDFSFIADEFDVDFANLSSNYESLSWDFGDGTTSTLENPSHTYATEDTYEVILYATNDCGTIQKSETLIISTLPSADYFASITTGCVPLIVEYTDNSSANATAWLWTFPGGSPSTSTEQNPTVSYTSSGVFDVSLTVSSAAGDDTFSNEEYITTQDVPVVNFEFSKLSDFEFAFINNSINADVYSWDFGDGNSSPEENPQFIYAEEGTYTVVLSATNICGTVTYEVDIIVSESTSVDDIDILGSVNINPNPNRGDFVLSMNAIASGEVQMEIYNILGQKIKTDQFEIYSGINNRPIQLENQNSGAYLILLRKGDQSRVLKFLVH